MTAQVQEQEVLLPIDIHYNKLLDWLINRRHCKQEWQSTILEIREKINGAIQDMPPTSEITQLIKGSHINYFHCRRIFELLKETESGTKNIFGYYSSQRLKDWQEIMKLYEVNDLYLAEAAQLLARNVNYEVPVLKKQIAKCQQTQKDCAKKETDYHSTAGEYKEKYTTMCKQLGIEGKNIRKELMSLVSELPNVYSALAEECKELVKARQFYVDMVHFTGATTDNAEDILKTLHHLQTKGNTTLYEFNKGKPPKTIIPDDENVIQNGGGDAAVTQNGVTESETIDWGDVAYDPADISLEIDYDLGDITIEDDGMEISCDTTDFGASIDFGDDEISVKTPAHVTSDSSVQDDGIARGKLAMSVLDHTETRNAFLDDLMEIEAFLTQRQAESQSTKDILSSCQFDSAPESLHVDDTTMAAMLSSVKRMLGQLTSVRLQHLCLIRNAPRYVERLEEKLKQNLAVSEKMLFYQKQSVERRLEAKTEAESIRPKVDILVKQTHTLQQQVEEEISKRYKNRPVNIMGEINSL